jgi:hypothetical protein
MFYPQVGIIGLAKANIVAVIHREVDISEARGGCGLRLGVVRSRKTGACAFFTDHLLTQTLRGDRAKRNKTNTFNIMTINWSRRWAMG